MTRPGTISGGVAVLAAASTVVLAGVEAGATLAGLAGMAILCAGLYAGRRRAVTGAACLLGTATLLAGLDGVPAPAVVAATGAVVVAWTLGQTSVDLAAADEATRTVRLELVHVAGTTAVGTAAGSLALAPLALDVSASPLGVVLVLFGAGTLTATLLVAD